MSFGSSKGVNPGRKKRKKNVQSPTAQNTKFGWCSSDPLFWVGCFWLILLPKNWGKERHKTSRVVIISKTRTSIFSKQTWNFSNSGLHLLGRKKTNKTACNTSCTYCNCWLFVGICFFQGFVNTQLRSITNFLDSLSLPSWYLVGTTPGFCFNCGSQEFYWAANCFVKFPKTNSFNCLTPLYYLISSPGNPPLAPKKDHRLLAKWQGSSPI